MKYNFERVGNVTLSNIQTNKFKTNVVKVSLVYPFKKEEIILTRVLAYLLELCNNKYPSRESLTLHLKTLYDMQLYSNYAHLGNIRKLEYAFDMIDYKFTKENLLEEAFKLANEIIFNPLVKNNQFDEENFKEAVKVVTEQIKTEEEAINSYARQMTLYYSNLEDPVLIKKDRLQLINNLTNEAVYDFYLKLIKEAKVKISVISNYPFNEVKTMLTNNFSINNFEYGPTTYNNKNFLPKRGEHKTNYVVKEVEETIIDTMWSSNDYDHQYITIIRSLFSKYLNSLGGDLFQRIREQKGLSYWTRSANDNNRLTFSIMAGISKEKEQETLQEFKDIISDLSAGKINEKLFNDTVNQEIIINEKIDNTVYELFNYYNNYEDSDYNYHLLPDEKIKVLKTITPDNMVDFAKSLKLHQVVVLGDFNEEN